MRFSEYIHASQHVPMGSGPMECCDLCKSSSLKGEVEIKPIITKTEFTKTILIAAIGTVVGGVVSELVVKRWFKRT